MSRDRAEKKRKRDDGGSQSGVRKRKTPRHHITASNIEYLERGIAEDASENHRDVDKLLRMIDPSDPGAKANVQAGVSLCKIFSRLIASTLLTKDGAGSHLSQQLHDWYRTRYGIFQDLMVKLLESMPVASRTPILHLCWKVLEQDAELLDNSVWASGSIFNGLLTAVVELVDGSDIRQTFMVEYINQCHDCCYHSLECFSYVPRVLRCSIASSDGDNIRKLVASSKDEEILENIAEMLSFLDMPPKSTEELNFLTIPENRGLKRQLVTPTSLRREAENAWLSILRSPLLGAKLRKSLLRIASTKMLPWMSRPETLMDFLTDSYNVGGSTSLLALSGLYQLISSKNLDYPSFYPKLYSVIDADLLQSKHRSRFLRLLNTFLESPRLPASLIASFIKRLARRALFAPPAAIVAIVPYIYNLLKAHPTCTFMIHREVYPSRNQSSSLHPPSNTTTANVTATAMAIGQDPFNMDEPDPQNNTKTHALESSLWELHTLQSHYHPNVASLASIISQQFTKQRYNVEDFLDHGYGSMLDTELAREIGGSDTKGQRREKKSRSTVVVEWRIPKHIFTRSDEGKGEENEEVDGDGDDASGPDKEHDGHQESLITKLWRF